MPGHARRGWIGLCGYVNADGNIREIGIGTGQYPDTQYYLDRPRSAGNLHGQAPALWCAWALLKTSSSRCESAPSPMFLQSEMSRLTPAGRKCKVFERTVRPSPKPDEPRTQRNQKACDPKAGGIFCVGGIFC